MKNLATLAVAILFLAAMASAQANNKQSNSQGSTQAVQTNQGAQPQLALPNGERGIGAKGEQRIMKEVRHVLVMEPYYTLWDNLEYKVDGDTVTLIGQVVNSALKSDAEHDVARIEGVRRVVNQIQVLPPAPMDDHIRVATARAIFNTDGLSRYAWGAVPPIHIIVDRGHVTLEGVVSNAMDKQLAGTQANSVPGVFSVTNDLRVENNPTEAKK